ncbi:MAG TPA: hypothetical protein VEB64_06680 [Azospirillaceae bacterium]|nr:hypothetical protein [Azospirillaceae bacterium]
MADYVYQMTHKYRDKSRMDAAEDWLRANARGTWAFEFLGVSSEYDDKLDSAATVYHVRYKFERGDEIQRFRDEYLTGRPAGAARPTLTQNKPKKGLFSRLFG